MSKSYAWPHTHKYIYIYIYIYILIGATVSQFNADAQNKIT